MLDAARIHGESQSLPGKVYNLKREVKLLAGAD